MRYHEYEPHEILRDTVRCFWIHEGDEGTETEEDITPDGCVELIFNFGSPYVLRTKPEATELPAAVIVGFQNRPIPLVIRGKTRAVAARLFAWGALGLVEHDVSKLTRTITPAGGGWGALEKRLREEVEHGRYEDAVRTLEDFLIERAVARAYDPKIIQTAAKMLHHTKGRFRIAELADHCRMSVRQLERGFQRVVGTTPKTLARTLRFEEAQRRLMFDPETSLTDLAHDSGYFDQAHFIKDFKEFAGKTPTEHADAMREFQRILKSKDVVFLQFPGAPAE